MAWIVEDEAHSPIERREQPYLTDAMQRNFEAELMPRYEHRRAALLPLLHAIQNQYNWLPYQALEEAAAFIGISFADVLDTVTFYEQYFLKPHGKHVIQICQSISCELCGQKPLMDKLMSKLDIIPGETTDDGKFTLMELECLGACGGAPALLINDQLYENVTWERLEAILEDLPD